MKPAWEQKDGLLRYLYYQTQGSWEHARIAPIWQGVFIAKTYSWSRLSPSSSCFQVTGNQSCYKQDQERLDSLGSPGKLEGKLLYGEVLLCWSHWQLAWTHRVSQQETYPVGTKSNELYNIKQHTSKNMQANGRKLNSKSWKKGNSNEHKSKERYRNIFLCLFKFAT